MEPCLQPSNFRTAVCVGLSACAFLAGSVSHAQTILRVPTDQATLSAALATVPDGGIIEMAAGTYQAPHGPRPEPYTTVLRGKSNGTGVGVVEVYVFQ